MNQPNRPPTVYRLDRISVVDVGGADAATIVHNVTTNEVRKLVVDEGRETFITDVRGKTLGHGCLFRVGDFFRLIGPAGQSDRIIQHVDRYTIREDAVPTIGDDDFTAIVIPPSVLSRRLIPEPDVGVSTSTASLLTWMARLGAADVRLYRTPWLGKGSCVGLIDAKQVEQLEAFFQLQSIRVADEVRFHHDRVLVGFPWYGTDLTDANLPQEADRDEMAISFTKGCYLGQETVARLDALGQVQKRLVRWSIVGSVPSVGATLTADGKTVGRLTSITTAKDTDTDAIAIGFARRSHFEAGASATGSDFVATVLESRND